MPDLSAKAAHEFWNQYEDRMIYRVVSFLEGVENWTLDGDPELEAALAELGQQLDDLANVDVSQLDQEDLFIKIANSIKSARTLRLLQALDTAHPGSASKLLIYAEENSQTPNDAASIFLRRNIAFERLRLLSRILSKERLDLLAKALEGDDHD